MDWKAKVDLVEQLRREHEFGIGTIAGVAAKFGVHRRVVRQVMRRQRCLSSISLAERGGRLGTGCLAGRPVGVYAGRSLTVVG